MRPIGDPPGCSRPKRCPLEAPLHRLTDYHPRRGVVEGVDFGTLTELCYAPQFGSAKDAVNFAGMIAGNILRGDMPVSHWDAVDGAFLLDVRSPAELVLESVPGAVNIPLPQLRSRLGELPKDRKIEVICRSAQRAHYATRILLQNGFAASTLSGGMLSRAMMEISESKNQ